eukprot:m.8554 g.8554  ORF g.8554 m.8554 type:complete len:381 (+) comp3921_c0_seq1:128-1270(+)
MEGPYIARPGDRVEELDTPTLLVDMDKFEANLSRFVDVIINTNKKQWRPHTKGYKSPAFAKKLINAGACGVTVAKLGEAEVMANAGIQGILIANQIALNPHKLNKLVQLLKSGADITLTLDSIQQAQAIGTVCESGKVRCKCIIEVDIGMERGGVSTKNALVLAKGIAALPALKFVGIMGYEGHALKQSENQRADVHASVGQLVAAKDEIIASGLEVPIVSCGGTGSFIYSSEVSGVTELQAGGGVLCDMFYHEYSGRVELQLSLTILATVTSRPTARRIIVDAGRKTMVHWSDLPSMPVALICDKKIPLTILCAEHGVIELSADAPSLGIDENAIKIGAQMEIIPAYHDLTNVLHDRFVLIRKGVVEDVLNIPGRGRLD